MTTEKLGNLAEFRNGLNYTDADNGSGLAVVGVADFKDKVIIDTGNLPQLSLSALSKPDALIQEGDILFVRSNGNRELIGRSVYVNDEPAMPTSHSGFTIRCRFHDRRCYPRYYAYLFRGSIVRQILSAHGGGTNISNLNQQILADLEVPVPDRWVQERIAAILSAYDDLIEVNQRRIAVLEGMARSLFNEWFVRFGYPGHEAVPLVETELGMVPEGWIIKPVADVIVRRKAGNVYKENDVLGRGAVIVIDQSTDEYLGFHDSEPDHPASPETPLMIFGDHTCKLRLLTKPFSVGPNTVVFGAREPLPSQYIFGLIHGAVQTREYKRHWSDLSRKRFPVAPAALANQYKEAVLPIFKQCDTLREVNRNLVLQRELLLPKLISGEIDVASTEKTFAEAAE